jgi:asparagine synthase (glutamine-hydrolysing)
VPGVSREIDLTALSDYLSLLYVPWPKSIFRSIRKLPPAHYAVVTGGTVRLERYWDLAFEPDLGRSEEALADDLLPSLEEATRLRMISDVPLGAFLSGGVDSSAVVALMARIRGGQPVLTNSIAFGEAGYDETPYAREVAALFGTDHHEFRVAPEAVAVVEKLAWHYDEPFADSSAVPTYYVSKMARENVTVSLSGDGGDENFAGYTRYWFDERENRLRSLIPPAARGFLFGAVLRGYEWTGGRRGRAFVENVARSPADAYFRTVSACCEAEKGSLLHRDVVASLGGYRSSERFRELYAAAPASDHLSKILYLDVNTYLTDDILTKVDRASMAVSLEVRCPVLDHVFMEAAARIPSSMKLKGQDGKYIFKKALTHVLPRHLLYRQKQGFAVPVTEWLRTELSDYGRQLILDGEATRKYLNRGAIERLWQRHQAGVENRSAALWGVMMLNLWQAKFG